MNWIDEGLALIRARERLEDLEAAESQVSPCGGPAGFLGRMTEVAPGVYVAGPLNDEFLRFLFAVLRANREEHKAKMIDASKVTPREIPEYPPDPPPGAHRRRPRPRWSDLVQLLIAGLAVVCLLLSAIKGAVTP